MHFVFPSNHISSGLDTVPDAHGIYLYFILIVLMLFARDNYDYIVLELCARLNHGPLYCFPLCDIGT